MYLYLKAGNLIQKKMKEADLNPMVVYHGDSKTSEEISFLTIVCKLGYIEIFKELINDKRISNSHLEIEYTLYYITNLRTRIGRECVELIFNKGNSKGIDFFLDTFDCDKKFEETFKDIVREHRLNQLLEV